MGRGRARAALVVALAAAAVGAALGCAGDDDATPPSTTTEATGDPHHVPAAFAVRGEDWAAIGATDDRLVGLGGPASTDDRFGQAFDLETGALTDIPPPPFDDDREVQVEKAVFGADHVIVGAFVYGQGIDPDEVDPTLGEPPSELITYRLDPADRSWTRLALPAEYAQTSRLTLRSLDAIGSEGAVALLDGGITREAVLATLDGDDWVVVGENGFTDPLSTDYCATDTTFWQLNTFGANEDLRPLSLADGSPVPLTPPARITDDEWEMAKIGCTTDAVVLAVSNNREQRPAVFVSGDDGTTWEERADPFGPGDGFLGGTASGAEAAVVWAGGMEPEPTGQPVVVTSSGDVLPMEGDRDDLVVWRGRTGSYLVVDRPDPAAPEGAGDDPAPIRQIDLP